MKNQLDNSPSLYLRQHASNPVDWQLWSPENLLRAKEENKLILISIGYASCHWCHVMERQSFEDPEVAEYMNENYFCIKVDKEEYPDVDSYYMQICTAMTGQGGWPLNVFLAPDGTPIFAGTYFPPQPSQRTPSWLQVLMNVKNTWDADPEKVKSKGEHVVQYLDDNKEKLIEDKDTTSWDEKMILEKLKSDIDPVNGGFFSAPKFPFLFALELLYDLSRKYEDSDGLKLFDLSLRKMLLGGIYDQVAGGMMRYSTDNEWIVPHFEKMLYTNAPIIGLLAKLENNAPSKDIYDYYLDKTWNFLNEYMRNEDDLFGCSIDADTPEGEGYYYSYTYQEAMQVLEDEANLEEFGVSKQGNFEGRNILHFQNLDGLDNKKSELNGFAEIQNKRTMPQYDPKSIFSWNALLALNLAKAYVYTEDIFYYNAFSRIFKALDLNIQNSENGPEVIRIRYLDDQYIPGRGEDYAYACLIQLYAYRFFQEEEHLEKSQELLHQIEEKFEINGLFTNTPYLDPDFDLGNIEFTDDSIPSLNALMYENYQILALYTKNLDYLDKSEKLSETVKPLAMKNPAYYGYFISMITQSFSWQILETNASWDEIYTPIPMNLWLRKEPKKDKEFLGQLCDAHSCKLYFRNVMELQDYLEQYHS